MAVVYRDVQVTAVNARAEDWFVSNDGGVTQSKDGLNSALSAEGAAGNVWVAPSSGHNIEFVLAAPPTVPGAFAYGLEVLGAGDSSTEIVVDLAPNAGYSLPVGAPGWRSGPFAASAPTSMKVWLYGGGPQTPGWLHQARWKIQQAVAPTVSDVQWSHRNSASAQVLASLTPNDSDAQTSATIELLQNGVVKATQTGVSGWVAFSSIPAGVYDVRVVATNYYTVNGVTSQASSAPHLSQVTIEHVDPPVLTFAVAPHPAGVPGLFRFAGTVTPSVADPPGYVETPKIFRVNRVTGASTFQYVTGVNRKNFTVWSEYVPAGAWTFRLEAGVNYGGAVLTSSLSVDFDVPEVNYLAPVVTATAGTGVDLNVKIVLLDPNNVVFWWPLGGGGIDAPSSTGTEKWGWTATAGQFSRDYNVVPGAVYTFGATVSSGSVVGQLMTSTGAVTRTLTGGQTFTAAADERLFRFGVSGAGSIVVSDPWLRRGTQTGWSRRDPISSSSTIFRLERSTGTGPWTSVQWFTDPAAPTPSNADIDLSKIQGVVYDASAPPGETVYRLSPVGGSTARVAGVSAPVTVDQSTVPMLRDPTMPTADATVMLMPNSATWDIEKPWRSTLHDAYGRSTPIVVGDTVISSARGEVSLYVGNNTDRLRLEALLNRPVTQFLLTLPIPGERRWIQPTGQYRYTVVNPGDDVTQMVWIYRFPFVEVLPPAGYV